jgi:RNA polymerase sigma factor (sigma-70 family)
MKDQDILDVVSRVCKTYCKNRDWLPREDVLQEGVALAYEEIARVGMEKFDAANDPQGMLGYVVKLRLVDWQRKQKILYTGKKGKKNSVSTRTVEYIEYAEEDRPSTACAVEEMGYWFIEEYSEKEHNRKVEQAMTSRNHIKVGAEPSERELEVISLTAEGLSTTEIGEKMHISMETIKSHTKNLRWKLSARNTTHAVAICLREGLIK